MACHAPVDRSPPTGSLSEPKAYTYFYKPPVASKSECKALTSLHPLTPPSVSLLFSSDVVIAWSLTIPAGGEPPHGLLATRVAINPGFRVKPTGYVRSSFEEVIQVVSDEGTVGARIPMNSRDRRSTSPLSSDARQHFSNRSHGSSRGPSQHL